MGQQYTMNLSPVPGTSSATSDQAGKVACLGDGDSVMAQIGTAFGAGANITAMNFFVSSPNKASGARFMRFTTSSVANKSTIVTYPSGGPPNSTTLFGVSAPMTRQTITITDDEGTPNTDQHVWFTIEVTDSTGKVWTLDPEVINTTGNDPRRGFNVPTEQDGQQTLGNSSSAAPAAPTVVTRPAGVPAPTKPY